MHPIFVDIENELKRVRQESESLRLAVERFSQVGRARVPDINHWDGEKPSGCTYA